MCLEVFKIPLLRIILTESNRQMNAPSVAG